jgi:hypothetical protein
MVLDLISCAFMYSNKLVIGDKHVRIRTVRTTPYFPNTTKMRLDSFPEMVHRKSSFADDVLDTALDQGTGSKKNVLFPELSPSSSRIFRILLADLFCRN